MGGEVAAEPWAMVWLGNAADSRDKNVVPTGRILPQVGEEVGLRKAGSGGIICEHAH